jgi:hypothetical protein
MGLGFSIADGASKTLFDFSAQIFGRSAYLILVPRHLSLVCAAATRNCPNQNSQCQDESQSDEGAMLDFRGNPIKCLVAEPPSDPDGLIAEARCFVEGQTPNAAQPISVSFKIGVTVSATCPPNADALTEACRPALRPNRASSFSMARRWPCIAAAEE